MRALIQTERLWLRPTGVDLLESVYRYASDLENTRYMMHLPLTSRREALDFLEGAAREWEKPLPEFYELAVMNGQTHIGAVSLYLYETRDTGELGWILDKAHWGHGYAFEAAEALVRYAVRAWGVRHFMAHCDADNIASWRTMEKLGMKRIGIEGGRKNRASDRLSDEVTYEMIVD